MKDLRPVPAQKALLRNELRQKLAALEPAERLLRSRKILEAVLNHPAFIKAKTLLTYLALPLEVETRSLAEEARKRGKKVYAPRLDRKKKEIEIFEMIRQDDLAPGPYGILEPSFDPKRLGRPEVLELVIVPGLGFDRRGGRLGRGQGYFDRFLKKAKGAYKIGLAFECQIVEQIPQESGDAVMDEVIIG